MTDEPEVKILDLMDHSLALQTEITRLKEEVTRYRKLYTDASYWQLAYQNMLGPKALQAVMMWRKKGITRLHFDWGPEAHKMSGEERAQFILDLENAPTRKVEFIDDEPVEIKDV